MDSLLIDPPKAHRSLRLRMMCPVHHLLCQAASYYFVHPRQQQHSTLLQRHSQTYVGAWRQLVWSPRHIAFRMMDVPEITSDPPLDAISSLLLYPLKVQVSFTLCRKKWFFLAKTYL